MTEKILGFHVGAHKTGTSLIQRHLERFPDTFAGHGLEFVTRDEMSELCNWGRRLVRDPEPMRQRLAAFRADSSHRALFGSYENLLGLPFLPDLSGFYPRAGRSMEALSGLTGGLPTKIFFSIRRQSQFVESWYLQTVHMGSAQPFESWLADLDLDDLSWRPAVDAMIDAFGIDSVEIVDFSLIKSGQGRYIGRFLRVIDPAWDDSVDPPTPYNRSVSAKGLELALAANPLLREDAERRALRKFLQWNFSNVDHPRPRLLDPHQAAELDARYAEEYAELIKLNSFDRGLVTVAR